MFENEVKFLTDFTLNKIKDLGSFFTIEKLLAADIHPAIKKYVEGEIDYLIYSDRKKLIENSLFDYSGAAISNYFNLIAKEIKKTKKISYEDIKKLIFQAVSFNTNYVVRPKWSISKLVFGNSKSVSFTELQMMLNYTYYYEYLNSVFLAYMTKKKILNISLTEFELIMNKIDRELFTLNLSKLVDNALYAIADFFSIGGLNKSVISIENVEVFLKEKNLTDLLFKLKREFPLTGKKKAEIEDIRKALYSAFPVDIELDEKVLGAEQKVELPAKQPEIKILEPEEPLKFVLDEENKDLKQEKEPDKFAEEEIEEKSLTGIDISAVDNLPDEEIFIPPVSTEESNDEEVKDEIFNVDELLKNSDDEENKLSTFDSVEFEQEDILKSLTEDLKESDDELIILDDKGTEELIKFYDNELEINIDEERELKVTKNDEINEAVDKIEHDIEETELENELSLAEETEEEIEIEKLDFGLEKEEVSKVNINESETAEEKPLIKKKEDIFSFLSRKEIEKIINSLFNSDSEEFANTIEKISNCKDFEEATEVLNSIFEYARIKPHSKDANLLTNAVKSYFNQDV